MGIIDWFRDKYQKSKQYTAPAIIKRAYQSQQVQQNPTVQKAKNWVRNTAIPASKQYKSLPLKRKLSSAAYGGYRGVTDMLAGAYDIAQLNPISKIGTTQAQRTQARNTLVGGMRAPLSKGSWQPRNQGERFGAGVSELGSYLIPFGGAEKIVIGGATKVLPKLATKSIGGAVSRFGVRRGADVASGQLLTPSDRLVGDSRLKQAGADILLGGAGEGLLRGAGRVTKTVGVKTKANNVANLMDAPYPTRTVNTTDIHGIERVTKEPVATKRIEVPVSDFEHLRKTGNLPKQGDTVVKDYRYNGTVTAEIEPETGKLVTWRTDNPNYAKFVQENKLKAGFSTRDIKPSEGDVFINKADFKSDNDWFNFGREVNRRWRGGIVDNGEGKYEINQKGLNRLSRELKATPDVIKTAFRRYKYQTEPFTVKELTKLQGKPTQATDALSNEARKPIVAYHGTASKFDNFDMSKSGLNNARTSKLGVWFTNDQQVAKEFADTAKAYAGKGGKSIVRKDTLNLENPFVIEGKNGQDSFNIFRDELAKFTQFEKPGYNLHGRQIEMQGDKINYEGFKKYLSDQGYDGIVIKNTEFDAPKGKKIDQILVLDPKSVSPQPTPKSGGVRIGQLEGKVVKPPKVTGQELPPTSQVPRPSQLGIQKSSFDKSIAKPVINVNTLNISKTAKGRINKAVEDVKPQIEARVGARLSNKEVVKFAENSSKTLTNAVGREQTKQWEAALLKTRQQLAASAKSNTIDRQFIENTKIVKSLASDTARKLQSFGIGADPLSVTAKQAVLESVLNVEADTNKILEAAKGVDFNDANQATNFYRTFIKPNAGEYIDLIRYNSMLSSPLTHIKNITTNALQTIAVKPIEKTLTGVVDIFSKKPTNFAGEGLAYSKGVAQSWGDATRKFADVMRGKAGLTNLDLKYMPVSTSKGTKFLSFPTRMLDGMDQFFTTLGKGGETAALKLKQAKGIKIGNIDELAKEKASYTVFRSELGNTEQGYVLDGLDRLTGIVEKLRNNDNPFIKTVAKFTLPFVKTPMNIFKQGLEYSPAGFITTVGAKNVSEQVAKALIGSAVFGGAATLIGSGRLTWAEPINEKQRNEFRAAGMQPYSVKIGDKWISYKYLGPLAFPLAMTSAVDYEIKNGRMDDSTGERILGAVARYGEFLADQSYFKSMGDLLKAVSGSESSIATLVGNYPQQLVPLRALGGWLARITDPNQRKISKDAGFIEKQTQLLMQNIPGLSQKLETRPDTFGNPIPNQNRVFNAFSPLSVTTENPVGKDIYQSAENKRIENRQISLLKKGQGGQTDSGKIVEKVGDTWKTFTPQEYKVYQFEKQNGDYSTVGAQYQLDYQRAKRDDDIESYVKYSQDYLNYLYAYKEAIDPNDKKEQIKVQNKIDDTEYYLNKYMGYGGFKKGSSGRRSGRRSGGSSKSKAVSNKRISLTLTPPSTSFTRPTINGLRAPKISLKTIGGTGGTSSRASGGNPKPIRVKRQW